MPLFFRTLTLLVCCSLIGNSHADVTDTTPPQDIRDLRYGVTLYHFFQENYFSAITQLTVAEKRHPIQNQGADPELLLGSLYLSYGMHQAAGKIFTRLLNSNVPQASRDKAWYYLARLRYQGGHYASARDALEKIQGSLPPYHEGARWNLLTNILLRQHQYSQATTTLPHLDTEPVWQAYSEFNLGVTFSRLGKTALAQKWLDTVGRLTVLKNDEEISALRDRANLALGYTDIQAQQPDAAITTFGRIRLSGPLSNKALLGIGWAHYLKKDYNAALVPWMELRKRPTINTSVQEALLAIPHTLELLQKPKAALAYYNAAVTTYDGELTRLANVIRAVEAGELLNALKPPSMDDESLQLREQAQLPDSVSSPYLSNLLASHEFQNTYQSYRELLFLQHRLNFWQAQLPTYGLMLKEREASYQQKLKIIRDDMRLSELDTLVQRRDKLAAELKQIETTQNGLALAKGKERATLKRLNHIGTILQHLQGHGDYAEQEEKYRLLKGLLTWRLDTEFVPRDWQAKRQLIELDRSIEKTRRTRHSLERSWQHLAPSTFHEYESRLNTLGGRLVSLRKQIDSVTTEQARLLQQMAIADLHQRRDQLHNYLIRAKYGLTRLYDKLHKDQRGDR